MAEQLATMKEKYLTSEWYPFYQVYIHKSEGHHQYLCYPLRQVHLWRQQRALNCKVSRLTNWSWPATVALFDWAAEPAVLKFAKWLWYDIIFSNEELLKLEMSSLRLLNVWGSAAMLLQEARSWPGGLNAMLGYELFTDKELDTAVALPREIACNVREKSSAPTMLVFRSVGAGVWDQ